MISLQPVSKYFFNFFAFILCVGMFAVAQAQTVPVGLSALEDYYRRGQLAGTIDSNSSMMVRPVYPKAALGRDEVYYPDLNEMRFNLFNTNAHYVSADGKFKTTLIPLTLKTQINSHHGYGWNDGAIINAKGFQTVISGGIYGEYGPLSFQLMPELLHAENSAFEDFSREHYEIITARYYDFHNKIDMPVRMGNTSFSKVYLGQSSIRLNYKDISFGISTENLWWGPGMRNALLMSNNAPGFAHLTLNTRKPIATSIGSFEGQIVAGRLEASGFAPLVEDRYYFNSNLHVKKPSDWRYLSGFVLTYQPKWVSGLFLGMAKTAQMYSKDLNNLGDYLPFADRSNLSDQNQALNTKDQRSSYFMRWLWPAEKAEIYFEFGRSNFRGSAREKALNADASRGYTFGLRKLFPWGERNNEYLMIGMEATQLQQTQKALIDANKSWYANTYITHGYTHRGQVLGAGIGPGGNLQSVNIAWVKGLKTLGLEIERRVHNNDLYFYFFHDSLDFRRHWTDISLGLNGNWNFKNFLFNAQFKGVKSLNYQWLLLQNPGDPYMTKGEDAFNMQVQIGASYRF